MRSNFQTKMADSELKIGQLFTLQPNYNLVKVGTAYLKGVPHPYSGIASIYIQYSVRYTSITAE